MAVLTRPPGPRKHFLLGHTLDYLRDPLGFFTRCAREHGDVVAVRLVPWLQTYLVSHPDLIEVVLRGEARHFVKDRLTHSLSSLLGQGLLTSEHDLWRRQRRLIQPAFQLTAVQGYGPDMVSATLRHLAAWQPGQVRHVHEDMMALTLEIVARALFSADVSGTSHIVGEAIEEVMAFFFNPLSLPFNSWLPTPGGIRYRRAVRRLDAIILNMIRERRRDLHPPGDLLTRLLEARDEDGTRMTDRQVRDELMTLFLAGHETTALTLSYTLHLLARHPEVDARLAAELAAVLGDRPPAAEDVPGLVYLGWVVREAMRLYPPAWAIAREATEDCRVGDYVVPRGTQVEMSQWVVHRDPRWFPEPDRFWPERWDNDLARRLPRCAYFPFGDGPRICIGQGFALMEAALLLAAILQRFRLTPASDAPLTLVPSVTLRPRSGMDLVVHPRTVSA